MARKEIDTNSLEYQKMRNKIKESEYIPINRILTVKWNMYERRDSQVFSRFYTGKVSEIISHPFGENYPDVLQISVPISDLTLDKKVRTINLSNFKTDYFDPTLSEKFNYHLMNLGLDTNE